MADGHANQWIDNSSIGHECRADPNCRSRSRTETNSMTKHPRIDEIAALERQTGRQKGTLPLLTTEKESP